MGKKGKKKKGKKEAEKKEEKEELTEVDKELFQIQITDLQRKVERLKARCLELETSNQEYIRRYEQLDEDRADIIAYLKKVLGEKADEIIELQERLDGLHKAKEADKVMYEGKIEQLQHEYKNMQDQLTSEIKLLSGKLNSLEEFRIQREDLTKKFKLQEKQMEEQNQKHDKTLYEIERKFIVAKDKLKKDMEEKLLQVSASFQKATDFRIAASTHRTVRENITINNEMNALLEKCKRLMTENEKLARENKEHKIEITSHKEELYTALSKNILQNKLIKKLTEEHKQIAEKCAALQNGARQYHHVEIETTKTKQNVLQAQRRIWELENELEEKIRRDKEREESMYAIREYITILQKTITAAMSAIRNAIQVQISTDEESTQIAVRGNLLNNLLELLNAVEATPSNVVMMLLEKPSTKDYASKYMTGSLGLIPRSESEEESEEVTEDTVVMKQPPKRSKESVTFQDDTEEEEM